MESSRKTVDPPAITTVTAGSGPFAATRPREEPPVLRAGTAAALLFGGQASWQCFTAVPDDGDGD
ncbi:hypothetical protein [Arthrobacter sp. JSM 101049]|uniref:hypothetical protein n=1 Tax=Arthrobacter sp. JSM 101049 TaxID=929097 RepID=UPI0035697C2C